MSIENSLRLFLYHSQWCPYCVITRQAINELNIAVELHDIYANPHDRDELFNNTGRTQVPCLRIQHPGGDDEWMFESQDIIHFLKETKKIDSNAS